MATDRKLKAALLAKIKVTPQALSSRAKQVKKRLGPMSTEEAVYFIAHAEGLDISKFLSAEIVDRVRSFRGNGQAHQSGPTQRRNSKPSPRKHTIRISSDVPEVATLLPARIATDAKDMADVYPMMYVLENSLRHVIRRVLESKYGADWWLKKVSAPTQTSVRNRTSGEAAKPWHSKRGVHPLFYSDFKDLKSIVEKNWADFAPIFSDRNSITQKLVELEHPRNIIAHNNPLSAHERNRLRVYFGDIMNTLEARSDAIP